MGPRMGSNPVKGSAPPRCGHLQFRFAVLPECKNHCLHCCSLRYVIVIYMLTTLSAGVPRSVRTPSSPISSIFVITLFVHKSNAFFCPLYRPLYRSALILHHHLLHPLVPLHTPPKYHINPFSNPPPTHTTSTLHPFPLYSLTHPPNNPPSLKPTHPILRQHLFQSFQPFVHDTPSGD